MGKKGEIYLENLGMEGTIRLVGGNGGGIIGNNDGDVANLRLKNCYVTGDVLGSTRTSSGLLVGWAGTNAIIENCWGTGKVEGISGEASYFVNAFNSGSIVNSYCKYGTQIANITDEQVASGELCAMLGSAFRQNIGEDAHPVLDPTHGIVQQIPEAGYATMYNKETALIIPAGVEAFTGLIVDDQLWLRPLQNVIILGQAVVLKGAAGYYSFMPVDAGDGLIRSSLIGTEEPLEADGNQYVLAQKDGVVGFYQAEQGTTIPAGKAYLIASVGIKGFTFNTETGIDAVRSAETTDQNEIYDLSGRRVEKMQKGIYIVNGKKVAY
jgi:hypothetical protein